MEVTQLGAVSRFPTREGECSRIGGFGGVHGPSNLSSAATTRRSCAGAWGWQQAQSALHCKRIALRTAPDTGRWTRRQSSSFRRRNEDAGRRRLDGPRAHLELRGNGAASSQRSPPSFNGVFLLILLNIGLFVADHVLQIPLVKLLYLDHTRPRWYQFVAATFCHASWSHLSSNLFALYISGKLVEEEEGSFGVWASYLITGLGANVVSWLLLPRACISVGASGAVFGLYAVSVLVKIGWDWRKILEVLILGQFVVEKVLSEVQMAAAMGGAKLGPYSINHVAHLAGALVGVALIWLIARIPVGEPARKDLLVKQNDNHKPLL